MNGSLTIFVISKPHVIKSVPLYPYDVFNFIKDARF